MKPGPIFLTLGSMLLLLGGFFAWRAANPPLNDQQILVQNMNRLAQAASAKNSRGITTFMTEDFRWQGSSKREIQSQLAGFFYTVDKVEARIWNVKVEVKGETANVDGQFYVSYQTSAHIPAETRSGPFRSRWIKQNDEWKILSVEGAESLTR
jgi:hypothetical protein